MLLASTGRCDSSCHLAGIQCSIWVRGFGLIELQTLVFCRTTRHCRRRTTVPGALHSKASREFVTQAFNSPRTPSPPFLVTAASSTCWLSGRERADNKLTTLVLDSIRLPEHSAWAWSTVEKKNFQSSNTNINVNRKYLLRMVTHRVLLVYCDQQ